MTARRPTPPKDLGSRGRRFWADVVAVYELNVDELQLLVEVCRGLDELELLHALIADGVTVAGSRGQDRLHPALAEMRAVRLGLGRLLAQLGLPDPDSGAPGLQTPQQVRARRAAETRWAHQRARRGSA